jgi:hypothetical protein
MTYRFGVVLLGLCPWLFAMACGARSELLAPEETDAAPDAAPDHRDASPDVHDAAEEDALPPIDAFPDVPVPTDCPDAGATLVYVITEQNELYSFYPPTLAFTKIGTVTCPTTNGATPFSMAVNRLGVAYSVFTDGNLFQVSTANAACKATTYTPNQLTWSTFGMGYAGAPDGGDTLYVAEGHYTGNSKGLGTIDTTSFTLSIIGPFSPPLGQCELTGTGDGRLFAFCISLGQSGSTLAEIDTSNANVIAENSLAVGQPNDAFAYAFWGGDFWIFTAPGGATTVTEYDPMTKSESAVATLSSTIVGAGVSTCAPN